MKRRRRNRTEPDPAPGRVEARPESADPGMTRSGSTDPGVERFVEGFRRWAARPPRTPAAQAAVRLRGLLAESADGSERRPPVAAGRWWRSAPTGRGIGRRAPPAARRWWLAGATAALAAAVGFWLLVPAHPPSPASAPATVALALEPVAVDDSVAVIPLDDVTVLYLSLGTRGSLPAPERGVTR